MQKVWPQLVRLLREPRRLAGLHYSKVLAFAHQALESNDLETLAAIFDIEEREFARYQEDLLQDAGFRAGIEGRFAEVRGHRITLFGPTCFADYNPAYRLLYYCTRIHSPRIVVETGVLDGFSSAFWLKGLRDNGEGRLCSIDLPSREKTRSSSERMAYSSLPPDHEPGWVIPDSLRRRFSLRLGSARDLLLPWLQELGEIDVFYHDSLHTRDHMRWEYETAAPFLRADGLLISDDVFWNRAFQKFAREHSMPAVLARSNGIARKRSSGWLPAAMIAWC